MFLYNLLLLASFASQQSPQPAIAWEEDDRLATRYGAVVLEKSDEERPNHWRVTLNGRVLAETEDDELGLWESFEGDDDHDYVIFRRSTGGIACPYYFRVVETGPKGLVILSEEFGSCLDPKRTALYGSSLVLDMSAYIPHPDLLTPAEIRRRQQTTQIFTVRGGKVTMREELRK
jgi:hypothetical protein